MHFLVPSGYVKNLQASKVNSTSIEISWDQEECLERNGLPRNYVVFITNIQNMNIDDIKIIPINNRVYTANNLQPGMSYTFHVALNNSVGTGPYESVVQSTGNIKGKYYIIHYLYALLIVVIVCILSVVESL